ncbi:hypothetical protein ACFXKW_33700 [Streptomyces sp. NPDC059193]|uniref:hypothetical protein n=1 Tax=Streptomyces sp. NPDC059193 TaxID=3346763 RepID=UPI0036A7F8B5
MDLAQPFAEPTPLSAQHGSCGDPKSPTSATRISRRVRHTPSPAAVDEALARRGRVRVPWRLVASGTYPDVALTVYVKTAALGWRPEGCTAGVAVLAGYLRMSTSAVERGLRALSRPDPSDGVVELRTRRRTKPGGLGTTAKRHVRPIPRQEPFVWVPVVAAELLEPRQLRAWAALAYADIRGISVSEAQLGEVLVHHSGKRAGEAIGAGAASAVVDSLEGLGWLRVHRRQGRQGRHLYEVLERPDRLGAALTPGRELDQPTDARPEKAAVGDGSGSRAGNGSLATEEDLQTDGLVHEGGLDSSAVGETTVVSREAPLAKAKLADVPSVTSTPLALRADENPLPTSRSTSNLQAGTYTGPPLTFSRRIAWVLEPVACLLQRAGIYVQRQFARQLGGQLAEGVEPARLRARLEARFARTSPNSMRNVEGWLLRVAAVRWGCHDPNCEEGVLWHSGEPCTECLAVRLERHAVRERQRLVALGQCPVCRNRLNGEQCETCRPAPAPRTVHTTELSVRPIPRLDEEAKDALPRRCQDCGSWTDGQASYGRCDRCRIRFQIRAAETAAMDAAGAGLLASEKLAAAARACADVRRGVELARQAAVATGLDQRALDANLVAAAEEAAQSWTASRQIDDQTRAPVGREVER